MQKHSGMNQMGHTQAKKEVFLNAVSYSCSGHCSAAHMCAPEQPKQWVGQGRFLGTVMRVPGRWPWGGTAISTGSLFFFSLKDTVVLHRAQMLVTASSCMKKCLQNLWLLKHLSCGMCNFHHLPQGERWDFSLRGMHVVLTL